MKTPAEYIELHGVPFTDAASGIEEPCVDLSVALAAVQSALDDSERYRYLLMRAMRNTKPQSTDAQGEPLPL